MQLGAPTHHERVDDEVVVAEGEELGAAAGVAAVAAQAVAILQRRGDQGLDAKQHHVEGLHGATVARPIGGVRKIG
jgi:hypothetical protein